MDEEELLEAIHHLVARGGSDLDCDRAGHGTGHTCLPPDEDVDLPGLVERLSGRYGRPVDLVTDGCPAPAGGDGAPLLAPFGDRLVEMCGWTYTDRWIGCGAVPDGGDVRLAVLVAERTSGKPDEPAEDASWVDRVVAVTGWTRERVHSVDWTAVETRLATALPADYKELVERFGYGAFDGYLALLIPGGPRGSLGLVEHHEFWARHAGPDGHGPWAEPYRLHPAPGGLLQWARTEQRTAFYWLTEGADPDRWPILVTDDAYDRWDRFDGSTGEFVHRLLTDPLHPHSTARYFDGHWFMTYDLPDRD